MSTLTTIAKFRQAFYRLVGTVSADSALVENSEAADDVAYYCLTAGIRQAQLYLIDCGMANRWRKRSSAITSWTGSDAVDGGRYTDLPTDFLRLATDDYDSALVKANNDRWGRLISADDDWAKGDYYYLKNEQLWLARTASPPTTLYLVYHFAHPPLSAATASFDFPEDALPLGVAYAGEVAMAEGWLPRTDPEMLARNVSVWERKVKKVARQSRNPRKMQTKPATGRYIL